MLDSAIRPSETEKLPFPYNKSRFCHYEPIEKTIEHVKVLIVNDLLRYESDISALAKAEWQGHVKSKLEFERKISSMACDNIAKNVNRLVRQPKTLTVHLSEIANAAEAYKPDAIVMSGTYSDFDYYNSKQLDAFSNFIHTAKIPVLAICGAHQLVGMAFGSELKTIDDLPLTEKRTDRVVEYQYRFIKISDRTDPIFMGIDDRASGLWQDYTKQDDILRVWQNHGVQVM
ncbi:MAG TPA: hypothetical protein VEV84_14705, partial [Pyrinomonadaceae bacterium]|nr:hypothetical protein [Pyrinomonadaceae bacterium]